jgi:hypothetical protein
VTKASNDMKKVWGLVRWTKDRTSRFLAYTSLLTDGKATITQPDAKADLLAKTFFPFPPDADLSDIAGYTYPTPLTMPDITPEEVKQTIDRTKPDKAPGPDDIPSLAFHLAKAELSPHLCFLFNACLRAGYCPKHFHESKTVALRKPGRSDYTVPKAYRPIALLNTMGKILDAIIATRISYMAETHHLLPESHYGGRKGRSTETALHNLLEQIYSAWKEGMIASLLLDVSGAFDTVSHPRLLYNLRKRRVPTFIIAWVKSFLRDRYTELVLPDCTKPRFLTATGIPQGSPLSPILYIFYNADLVEDGGANQGFRLH